VLLLAACAGPGVGIDEQLGERLEPGGVVAGAGGSWLAATEGALAAPIFIDITSVDEPTRDVPLTVGVRAVGEAFYVAANVTAGASPTNPFVLLLPVPAGADPERLAVAVLDSESVYAPPDDDAGSLQATWTYIDSVVEDAFIAAPIVGLAPNGFTAVVVEHDAFDSRAPDVTTSVTPLAESFTAVCGPGFDDAPETCTAADRDLLAAMLEEAYLQLTALGFTDDPRLARASGGFELYLVGGLPIGVTWVPGPYRIELRPLSTVPAGTTGMFSSSSGNVWIAIGTGGLTEARRRTVRHEYVHATQYGYDPVFGEGEWLASRWVIEGQAVVADTSFVTLQRSTRDPREVDTTLQRSRWDGTAMGPLPASEYQAQDFWFYLAQRFAVGIEFLEPFMAQGLRATDVDSVLRREYADAFGAAGLQGGLPRAYWDWVRNQVFEKQVDMRSLIDFGTACSFASATATPVTITYNRAVPPSANSETLPPLTTRVYRVDFPTWSGGGYGATMNVTSPSGAIRSVFFRDGAGAGCANVPDQSVRSVAIDAQSERYYVLVANTSFNNNASYTLSFDTPRSLVIDSPAPNATFVEGSVPIQASIEGAAGADVAWVIEGLDSDFLWTPTTSSGAAGSVTLCDGTYRLTATASGVGSGAQPSASVQISVSDLGAIGPPAACMPSVTVLEPAAGGTFTTSTTLTLRADARSRGVTTYPIEWRLGSANGAVIATGAEATYRFAAGSVDLYVTYGVASDQVSFTVVDDPRDPPTAVFLDPEDGASFPWFDETVVRGGHLITFVGLGSGADGFIGGDSVRWFARRTGSDATGWWEAGRGTVVDIYFGWSSCTWQTYDVRLDVVDSIGLVGSETRSISVQPPVC